MDNNTIPDSYSVYKAAHYFIRDFYTCFSGFSASVLGMFLPIKNIVLLLIIFFILDVAFGFWAAKTRRNEKFSVKIIWQQTMPRMLISVILVMGAFMWDTVYSQDIIATYKIVGWFISGVLLFSIAQNGYEITRWKALLRIGEIIDKGTKDKTGFSIDDKN